jgi:hypothetical protein
MESTPIFFHGREGTNQGRKARWLAREYGACTPGYETNYLSSAMHVARQVLKDHQPTAIVGSSFGGAVLLNLIQAGLWKGPSVFLAQAGIKFGLPVEFPLDVPAVFIHGTRDDIVSIEDSRALADCGGMPLIEVDDDHRLGSIRESGVLAEALSSLGVKPLGVDDDSHFYAPRDDCLDWLAKIAAPGLQLEERIGMVNDQKVIGPVVGRSLLAALRGTWREVDTADAIRARRFVSALFHRNTGGNGFCLGIPGGVAAQEVDPSNPEPESGKIGGSGYGTSMYEPHFEWPINGMGVRKDHIEVVVDDGGPGVPIFQWLREEGKVYTCRHCGGLLSDRVEPRCPTRGSGPYDDEFLDRMDLANLTRREE